MPEQNKPFVVTDRRKFTMDGELRPDADPSPEKEEREVRPAEPATIRGFVFRRVLLRLRPERPKVLGWSQGRPIIQISAPMGCKHG